MQQERLLARASRSIGRPDCPDMECSSRLDWNHHGCVYYCLVFGILGLGLKQIVKVPNILGYVSTMTRDNPYFDGPVGGEHLDGIERARLLRGKYLRLMVVNDTSRGEGHVALASDEKDQATTSDRTVRSDRESAGGSGREVDVRTGRETNRGSCEVTDGETDRVCRRSDRDTKRGRQGVTGDQ